AVRRLQPEEPFWTASTAAIMLGLGDTAFVDSALARVLRSGVSREALLLSGLVALRRGQETRARALLGRALIAGADTAETVAAEQFLVLVEFGIEPGDAPAWLERCRRGETR